MKKENKIINSCLGCKALIWVVSPTSNGTWIKVCVYGYEFEVRINDTACNDAINAGRVTHLIATDTYFTEDNAFQTDIAHYNGKWLTRPRRKKEQAIIGDFVTRLEKLPTHEAFEPKHKQTA